MKTYVAIVVVLLAIKAGVSFHASAVEISPGDGVIKLCNGLVNFALAVWGLLVLGAS